MQTFKFGFLLSSDKYLHYGEHDLLVTQNQASSMITGIGMKKTTPASIIFLIYTWFLIFASLMFSSLKEEFFIDGDEIKNICDVVRMFVVDDHRGTMAVALLFAIVPAVIYGMMTRFKNKLLGVSLLFFFLVWGWGFIYQYRDCLWF